MNVDYMSQPVTVILSIDVDDQLGYNVFNNLKVQIANDQYANLGKLLINNPEPNDDVKSLTYSNGTLSMSPKSKTDKYTGCT